jgi:hypothetical protein
MVCAVCVLWCGVMCLVGAKIDNFIWAIPECTGSCDSQSMSQVQAKLATVGPFAICVYAEPWQDYVGGIFNDASCTHAYSDLDHCVQLVGYTPSYWIVRYVTPLLCRCAVLCCVVLGWVVVAVS